MEWLKEILKKSSVEESKLDAIIGDIGKALPEHFVPKARYNEVAEVKKKLEADIAERDRQLEELRKAAGASEELKQQIEQLQAANKEAQEKYEAEMKELRINTALKLVLAPEVHDADLVLGLIDKSKIELDDAGNVKAGLDDQVKALRESKAFLFVQKEDGGAKFKGAKPPESSDKGGGGLKNPWSKEHFNLTEQGRILRENPELAKQLQAAAK